MTDKPSDKPSILIVDDNLTNLRVLIDYLNESGLETLVARSGKGALRQADFARPDLILLDVMMPGIDGFETCRQLKAKDTTKDIPVIFMTALSDTSDKIKGFEAGAKDYITKPFQQEEVLSRITTHLTLQQQKKALAQLHANKDKTFSILAHDMTNAFSQLLGKSKELAESFQEFTREEIGTIAGNIHDSAQNTFRLLENLLTWARIQQGTMTFSPRSIDLSGPVSENIRNLQAPAKQKSLHLTHTVAPGTYIFADPNILNTLLRNLISNALKFTHKGGQILVAASSARSTDKETDDTEITVSDTGIGISQEDMEKLFRIEQTYKRPGTTEEEGAGLGLILCKALVAKSGGDIRVESEPEKGTTIRITLPKTDPASVSG